MPPKAVHSIICEPSTIADRAPGRDCAMQTDAASEKFLFQSGYAIVLRLRIPRVGSKVGEEH
jgi:hypothetical protein